MLDWDGTGRGRSTDVDEKQMHGIEKRNRGEKEHGVTIFPLENSQTLRGEGEKGFVNSYSLF